MARRVIIIVIVIRLLGVNLSLLILRWLQPIVSGLMGAYVVEGGLVAIRIGVGTGGGPMTLANIDLLILWILTCIG